MEKTKIQTTINTELLNIFKKIAEKEGRHLNYYLEKGLEMYLNKQKEGDNKK